MNEDIFLSYRRKDGADKARLLEIYLERAGYTVFLDQSDIDTTGPFDEDLKAHIASCKDFVLILTPDVFAYRGEGDVLYEELALAYARKDDPGFALHVASLPGKPIDLPLPEGKPGELLSYFLKLTYLDILDFHGSHQMIVETLKTALPRHGFQSSPERYRARKKEQSSAYRGDLTPILNERMQRQAKHRHARDEGIMAELLNKTCQSLGKEKLLVLDAGAGNGFMGVTYFSELPQVGRYVGIDRNPNYLSKAIALAAQRHLEDRFSYREAAFGMPGFLQSGKEILSELGESSFDVIFVSHSIHHTPDPAASLRYLLSLLTPGGLMIVLNADDGMKFLYPSLEDPTLGEQIFDLCERLPHKADFQFGRKLYSLLREAGLRKVSVIPHVETNATILDEDDRRDFMAEHYVDHFHWRYDEFTPREEDSPEQAKMMASLQGQMGRLLEKAKRVFVDDANSFYLAIDFFAYGFKKK